MYFKLEEESSARATFLQFQVNKALTFRDVVEERSQAPPVFRICSYRAAHTAQLCRQLKHISPAKQAVASAASACAHAWSSPAFAALQQRMQSTPNVSCEQVHKLEYRRPVLNRFYSLLQQLQDAAKQPRRQFLLPLAAAMAATLGSL